MLKDKKPEELLGYTFREKITGYIGTAVVHQINEVGQERLSLLPPLDKKGKMAEEYAFDITQLEMVKNDRIMEPLLSPPSRFRFREKCKDPVTGFVGRVVSRAIHINGCVKIGLQKEVDKKGRVSGIDWFEEPILESIEPVEQKNKLPDMSEKRSRTGGPGRGDAVGIF